MKVYDLIALLIVTARLGERFGRKRVFVAGLIVFTFGAITLINMMKKKGGKEESEALGFKTGAGV